ncbi:MAG: thioredoxin-disulfide reductase [Oligoflexales bacterium]|nr:thioredoxin-disulfide reductase [Oligoflexales bacterium]
MNQVSIIGTGPAGLTAAIYCARAALEPVLYAGLQHGGQLTTTTEVENFPGFREGIMGPQLMQDMTAQAERFGADIIYEEITRVDFSQRPFKLWAGDKLIQSQTVIIATGATAKTLGLPNEAKLMGRGLSTCATCDGFFYKNKRVVVVGGGDSAMEEANYLSKLCSEVILMHRRAEFRASPIMAKRVQENPKIKIMTPYTVDDTIADNSGLKALKIRNIETSEASELAVDGLFMAIGHQPNSKIFSEYLDTDAHGYLKVHNFTETKIKGVFAAGDIGDPIFKQAITAAGMGCQAALQAQRFLEHHS